MVRHLELAKFIEKFVFFCQNFLTRYPPLWISKFKNFGRNIFPKTPPNWKYSIMNKIIVQNQIISLSLEHM